MHATGHALAVSRRRGGAVRFRANWMTPGLSSHQMLDAGVAARQHAARKALKKSKRPFENYFKVEFRRSQTFRLPRISYNGVIAARDAARLMTNPREHWRAPWDGTVWRLAKTRTDVVESAAPAFGDDPLDKVIEQLIDIRFEWDKEDDVIGPSLVPDSLHALTAHCAPYAATSTGHDRSTATKPSSSLSSALTTSRQATGGGEEEGGDVVYLPDGTTLRMPSRRRKPAYQRVHNAGGHPKRTYRKPTLGFNGVDVIPSLVVDAVRGPFVSSSTEPVLTVRWKADNRGAESVSRMLALRRRVGAVVAVGLTPRAAQLLLKATASEELEDPTLDVSLAVAMGENYGGYNAIECLEVLRALRRLALVRQLPTLNAAAPSLSSSPAEPDAVAGTGTAAVLYRDASLFPRAFHAYVEDAAPFLVDKVWAHLPDHSRHLLHDQLYLDWIDLLSLAVEVAGSTRLPESLPNPSSNAPYAAKYLFLRHTLNLDESVMTDMARCLHTSTEASAASHRGGAHQSGLYVDDEKELVSRPLILWLSVSLLVRVIAEALGDVVRHVQQSLHDHAQLAVETFPSSRSNTTARDANPSVEMNRFLDRLALARPLVVEPYRGSVVGSRGRRGGLRVRLLPFEAFPQATRLRPVQFQAPSYRGGSGRSCASERRMAQSAARRTGTERADRGHAGGASAPLESAFASVFNGSTLLQKHVSRATDALAWSAAILRQCHKLVAPLRRPTPLFFPTEAPSSSSEIAAPAPLQDGMAVQRRQALCYAYVRSRVESHMDTLFLDIPWSDLLQGGGLQSPWFDTPNETRTLEDASATAAAPPLPTADATPGPEVDEAAVQLAMMLAEDMYVLDTPDSDEKTAATPPASETSTDDKGGDDVPHYSEAEMAMRDAMQGLHEALGDFEVVVADVLDAYEDFFDIPRKEELDPLATLDSQTGHSRCS